MKKEIELKYRLSSKRDFQLFARFLETLEIDKKRILNQENYYFDTPSLSLKRSGISLRLRKQNSDYWLSAKQSLSKKKPKKFLSVRLEFEGTVDAHVGRLIKKEMLSALDAFSFLKVKTPEEASTKKSLQKSMKLVATSGIQMIGSFKNQRISHPISLMDRTVRIELDHSIYPQAIEIFEVEVEFASENEVVLMRPLVENLFKKAQVKTYQSISKSSRLFRILFG